MKTKELYYNQNGIVVERSTREDAEYIAYNMRQQDMNEIWASGHHTPHKAMKYTIEKTIFCLTVKRFNRPVAMFGVNGESVLGERGVVWMLSTEDIHKLGFRFVRHSRRFVDMMLEFYPYLYNYVHVDNTVSIAWLKSIGAKIHEPAPYGVENKLFHYFYFKKD